MHGLQFWLSTYHNFCLSWRLGVRDKIKIMSSYSMFTIVSRLLCLVLLPPVPRVSFVQGMAEAVLGGRDTAL